MQGSDFTRARWRKSSRSGGNGQCTEVARIGALVAVRDSKNPYGDILVMGVPGLRVLLGSVKAGRYDLT